MLDSRFVILSLYLTAAFLCLGTASTNSSLEVFSYLPLGKEGYGLRGPRREERSGISEDDGAEAVGQLGT